MCRRFLLILAAFATIAWFADPLRAQENKPELSKLRLAVGGKPALFYLPLTVTERLGYFKEEGLDVEISDFAAGPKALQALAGGSADMVAGSYDHTIQMQAKNQPIVAVVELGRYPGDVLGVLSAKVQNYRGFQDLKDMTIGITAPGSSTHFMAMHILAENGARPEDTVFIGIGTAASAIAAVKRGDVDALINVDPAMTMLESQNLIKVVADTRTAEGTRQVFGGPYPAAVIYTNPSFIDTNPKTVQASVNAFVRGLGWIKTHSAEEIAKIMPEDYALGDKALYVQAIKKSLDMFSPDGRISRADAETAYHVLSSFDPDVKRAKINLDATLSNNFVDSAAAAGK